jgi:allantoin racemase
VRVARLGLINPNTDPDDTDQMASVAKGALGPEVQLVALTAARGPQSIESAADGAIAAAEVVRLVAEHPELDCIVIGCFGDPGLEAARELTQAPVVGIGEAAYRATLLVARRFAVITTLARGVPELEDGMERLGVRGSCVGVLPIDIPVARQGAGFPESVEAIIAAGTEAVRGLGAEALVLACGAMTAGEATISERVGVPATSGVAVGALFAHALWRAGLRTSKVGSFAPPEPIAYAGMPDLRDGSRVRAR